MTVSIIVGWFGDAEVWSPLAQRALASARAQTVPCEVIESQYSTLHEARNAGGARATGEWLIFLDADDELEGGYVEAMLAGTGDLRQPSTLGIVNGHADAAPVLIPRKNLLQGNYIVIGAMLRRDVFTAVGGFRDFPAYEDWDLWIRCWLAGAEITACPLAVYRVHVRPDSRNDLSRDAAVALFNRIRDEHLPRAREMQLV